MSKKESVSKLTVGVDCGGSVGYIIVPPCDCPNESAYDNQESCSDFFGLDENIDDQPDYIGSMQSHHIFDNQNNEREKSYKLWNECKSEFENDNKEKSSGRGKKFKVTYGDKNGHPHSKYNNSNVSIHVNGHNGPILNLYRGDTYIFDIKGGKDRFVFTSSPVGGEKSIPVCDLNVSVDGQVVVKIDDRFPRFFYYQDKKVQYAGGPVIVHNP